MTSSTVKNSSADNHVLADRDRAIFIERLRTFDFVRLCICDLNGYHCSKLVSTRNAEEVAEGRCQAYAGLLSFGADGETVFHRKLIDSNFANGPWQPDPSTLYELNWLQDEKNSSIPSSVCEVICDPCWLDGRPVEASPRIVARRQLEALRREAGLVLFSAFEPEFQLFRQTPKYQPALKEHGLYRTVLMSHVQPFFMQLDHCLQSANINVQDFTMECGRAQLEAPIMPERGLAAADKAFLYRQIVKEVATANGYQVSFMTKPNSQDPANGWHFNHSLINVSSGEPVMFDPKDPDKLSEVSRHWLGGLLAHGRALMALCSPTVNCYRRLLDSMTPKHNDWGLESRFRSIRVKVGSANSTYIELRTPSSAACPYLVLAATVAAGLDGLKRKLEPTHQVRFSEGHSICQEDLEGLEALPSSLGEALDLLEADQVLVKALGAQFVSWFVRMRREHDLKVLKDVDLLNKSEEAFKLERERYFDFI